MKNVSEWDEEYIINLPPGEHDWIEFKGAKSLDLHLNGVDENKVMNELSKQMSAFANSGGGTLVYGIKDPQPGQKRQVDNGGIDLKIKKNTKAWLEDIIPNLVELKLNKFNVYVIEKSLPTSMIKQNKGLILIEIPHSENAPHQANDKRYYARVAGKSRPIGHRQVTDILGRAKYPKMVLFYKLMKIIDRLTLICVCSNVGKIYANYVNGFLLIPYQMVTTNLMHLMQNAGEKEGIVEREGKKYFEKRFSNLHRDIVNQTSDGSIAVSSDFPNGLRGGVSFYITRYDPVLPYLSFEFSVSLIVKEDELTEFDEERIFWEIYADNAPMEKGEVKVKKLRESIAELG